MDVENGSPVGAETFKIETRTMVEHHKMGCSSYMWPKSIIIFHSYIFYKHSW